MSSDAAALHADALVIDGHSSPELTEEYATETVPNAGIDVVEVSAALRRANLDTAIAGIREYQAKIDAWPGVEQIRNPSDLDNSAAVGFVFGLSDASPVGHDLGNVNILAQLGIRQVQLCYNRRNLYANGCTERVDDGLSKLGCELVDAVESNNLVLDLSHVGPTSAMEALEVSSQPTIFSHSNPSAVYDHPRNISDDLIEAAAATGGIVGLNAFPDFVGESPALEDLVEHAVHLADLVGPEHVSIGLDFIDGRSEETLVAAFADDPNYAGPPFRFPDGLESTAEVPNLTAALLDRGFSETEVRGILGENLRRVYGAVWGE